MRTHRLLVFPILIFCATQLLAAPTTAPSQSDFLRLIDKGTTGSRLETADVAYRNAEGVTVHLVAAVHVGEREYYQGLNQSFKLRDAVLYEMVKPRDVKMPAKPDEHVQSQSTISQVQHMMKDVLGLEFQLDVVDYAAPNFIHADMDAETFEKMQNERGESFTQMFIQQVMKAMSQPMDEAKENHPGEDLDKAIDDAIQIFTRPDMERQIKLRLARQMSDLENNPFGPGSMNGTVLLTERNKAAIAVLDKVLKDGKKDIAIFYGAAHMPEMSQMLESRGFNPIATEWRLAWDLTIRADQPSAVEKGLRELFKALEEVDGTVGDDDKGN